MTDSAILERAAWSKKGFDAAEKNEFRCPASFWESNGEHRRMWTEALRDKYLELGERKSMEKAEYLLKRAKVYCSLPVTYRAAISWVMDRVTRKSAHL